MNILPQEPACQEPLTFGFIHSDWKTPIGASIESEEVRKTLEADKSVNRILVRKILKEQEIGRFEAELLSEADLASLRILLDDATKFKLLAGLIWNSNTFAAKVQKIELQSLVEHIDIEFIKFAIQNRDLAPKISHNTFSIEALPKLAESSGARLVTSWAKQLPEFARNRVELLFPASFQQKNPRLEAEERFANPIIAAVSGYFSRSSEVRKFRRTTP